METKDSDDYYEDTAAVTVPHQTYDEVYEPSHPKPNVNVRRGPRYRTSSQNTYENVKVMNLVGSLKKKLRAGKLKHIDIGERGSGSNERGNGSSERGSGNSERGNGSNERGNGSSERGRGNSERGNGSRQRGSGSSERGNGSSNNHDEPIKSPNCRDGNNKALEQGKPIPAARNSMKKDSKNTVNVVKPARSGVSKGDTAVLKDRASSEPTTGLRDRVSSEPEFVENELYEDRSPFDGYVYSAVQ